MNPQQFENEDSPMNSTNSEITKESMKPEQPKKANLSITETEKGIKRLPVSPLHP